MKNNLHYANPTITPITQKAIKLPNSNANQKIQLYPQDPQFLTTSFPLERRNYKNLHIQNKEKGRNRIMHSGDK